MIKKLLDTVSVKALSNASTALVLIWIVFPIVTMLLNAIHFDAVAMYKIWISLVYVIGLFGVVFGIIYFNHFVKDNTLSRREKINNLIPYVLFLIFGIWCAICTAKAKFVFVAVLGYGIAQDSLSCYLAYFGFVMLGTILAVSKKNALIVANVTVIVADILAIVSLIDNGITELLNVNEFTNCFHYQSVYFNTNHYAYYLAIVVILCALLFAYSKGKIKKSAYLISFIIQVVILILNNTMGGYLAVLLTLVIYLIVCIVRKEKIKNALIIFSTFVMVSLISNLFVDNVFANFANMFVSIKTLLTGSSTQVEVNSVGSGRGILWKYALTIIRDNPIFGVGANNIYIAVHNAYLQIAMYTGIVGLILYCSPFVTRTVIMAKTADSLNAAQKVSLFIAMSFIISAFFGLTVFYTTPFFYVVVGIAFGITSGHTKNDKCATTTY